MNKSKLVKNLCLSAILKIDTAIVDHKEGRAADLSIPLLIQVKNELIKMVDYLSPSQFSPSYPRFIMDWPDKNGLVSYLGEVAYQYGRLK